MKINPFRQPPESPIRTEDTAPCIAHTKAAVRVWVSDDDALTQEARRYRCPSHGRSPRARVLRNAAGVKSFEGVCCRAAQDAIRLLAVGKGAEEPDADDEPGEPPLEPLA